MNTRRLWIDCEWNEFGGDLISMALVGGDLISMALVGDGMEWYEVFPCANPGPWVSEHVIPILGKPAIPLVVGQMRMDLFLREAVRGYDEIEIIADWPEDIAYFCKFLIVGPGQRFDTPPLRFRIERIDAGSAIPHNALADARGIMQAMRKPLTASA